MKLKGNHGLLFHVNHDLMHLGVDQGVQFSTSFGCAYTNLLSTFNPAGIQETINKKGRSRYSIKTKKA